MKDSELIVALAQILDAADVGVWNPAGTVGANDVAIFYGQLGTTPNQAVGITRYGGTGALTNDSHRGARLVQVRVRGKPDDTKSADDLADAVDAVLARMPRTQGLSSEWASGPLPLGADGNRRTELTLNYLVTPEG
ncbi:phage tail terminator protein [Promicromonospora iranensis]|uniref:DUF3168 domain-containing protein n=1 Tax=Promicromonospora iranensis TaxID=1105144 RepID=A0ABU2CV44_9MICO|nr:minor capsid protein [Promicromonospora iranensis]MDR7385209.1 hypothetical protein [Promicromonospora iranensis]